MNSVAAVPTFALAIPVRLSGFQAVDSARSSFAVHTVVAPCDQSARLGEGQLGSPCARMRNPGGFQLPPRVPATSEDSRRAIELLGSCTQRRHMRQSTKAQLETLVGGLPSNRLIAQQWKVSLQRLEHAPRRLAHRQDANAFCHRDALVQQLPLPRNPSKLSRMFILLEVVRRRYITDVEINPRVVSEISTTLGCFPSTALDAQRYIRALIYMQRLRRRAERRPPRVPLHDLEAMRIAHMLLGTFSSCGSIGSQTDALFGLIGSLPSSKNIALSWKKIIAAAIRKKKRKDRVYAKRIVDDEKRLQRRLKRLSREQQFVQSPTQDSNSKFSIFFNNSPAPPHDSLISESRSGCGSQRGRDSEKRYTRNFAWIFGRLSTSE